MVAGHRDAKPDERQQGIWQPVDPAETPNTFTSVEIQVQPHVQKLIDTEARNEIDI